MWKKFLIGAAGGIAGTLAMRYYWKGATKLHGGDPRSETRPIQSDIQPIEVLESQKEEAASGRSSGSTYASTGGGGATAGGLRSVGSTPIPRGRTKTGKSGREFEKTAKKKTRRRREALPILRPEARYRSGEGSTEALARIIYQKIRGSEPGESTKKRLATFIHWAYGAEAGATYATFRAGVDDFDLEGGLVLGVLMWLIGDEIAIPALGLSAGPQKFPFKQHVHRLGAHLTFGVATAAVTQTLWDTFVEEDPAAETSRWRSFA